MECAEPRKHHRHDLLWYRRGRPDRADRHLARRHGRDDRPLIRRSQLERAETGGGEDLFGASGNGPTDQFEVGSSGTILHWNGVSWSAMASGTTANLKAVETSGGGGFVDVWAVGSGGTILHGVR